MDAVRRIYREEGLRAFFRGLSVSYLGLTETAIQFTWFDWRRWMRSSYDIFKRKLGDNPSKLQVDTCLGLDI